MSTALDRPDQGQKQLTIRQHLESQAFMAEIAKVLPAHCKPERMIRVAITAITRTPKLAKCTPQSFFRCMLDLSQWGLEPDGRRAHLIPYENRRAGTVECQLILDYKGLVELAYRSGVVRNVHADIVRTGDTFRYSAGKVAEHIPHFLRTDQDKPEKEGEVFAAYCVIELVGGATHTEVMSIDEIFGIRNRSQGYQAFKKGFAKTNPWEDYTGEMCKKTVFRRASKWVPLSADLRDAFERDDDVVDAVSVTPAKQSRMSIDQISAIFSSDDPPAIEGECTQQSDSEHDPIAQAAARLKECSTLDQVDQVNAEILRMDLTDEQGMELSQLIEQRQAEIENESSRQPKGRRS